MARWCAVMFVCLGSACRGVQPTQQVLSWVDRGRLCIVPEAFAQDVVDGVPPDRVEIGVGEQLSAVVVFSECAPCARPPDAVCNVDNGVESRIVTASAQYVPDEGLCESGCEVVAAICPVKPLSKGPTVFEFGGEELLIRAPRPTPDFCVGAPTDLFVTSEQ